MLAPSLADDGLYLSAWKPWSCPVPLSSQFSVTSAGQPPGSAAGSLSLSNCPARPQCGLRRRFQSGLGGLPLAPADLVGAFRTDLSPGASIASHMPSQGWTPVWEPLLVPFATVQAEIPSSKAPSGPFPSLPSLVTPHPSCPLLGKAGLHGPLWAWTASVLLASGLSPFGCSSS